MTGAGDHDRGVLPLPIAILNGRKSLSMRFTPDTRHPMREDQQP
jgi:hypothetical protein